MDDLVKSSVSITTTANDSEWLARFLRELVDARLVACGNIIPLHTLDLLVAGRTRGRSRVSRHDAHPRCALFPKSKLHIEQSHPYDEPQFLVYPITSSTPGYAAWVRESTTPPNLTSRPRSLGFARSVRKGFTLSQWSALMINGRVFNHYSASPSQRPMCCRI